MCIAATVFYAIAAVLCFRIGVGDAPDTSGEEQPGGDTAAASGRDRHEPNDTLGEETVNARNDNNIENVGNCDPPKMDVAIDKNENDHDADRIASFETSVTELTMPSSPRGRETSISFDENQNTEPISADVPYDETVDIEQPANGPCELTINAAILNELEEIRKDGENSCNDHSQSSIHNDLVFDLM